MTTPTPHRSPGTRILCKRCWTSHFRSGSTRPNCPEGLITPLPPAKLAYILASARKQCIEEDIQAYAARKAS